MNINTIIIGGNLTRDPEIRVTPAGTQVVQCTIANNRKFKDAQGGDREEVNFVDVEAWGKTAELIAKHFAKGRPICVEGRIKQDQWEDKETGKKRSRLKVIADRFHFVGGKKDNDGAQSAPAAPQNPKSENFDEDVPF